MIVFVEGRLTALNESEIIDAVGWYCDELIPVKLLNKIVLTVRVKKYCNQGQADVIDFDQAEPNNYRIKIDNKLCWSGQLQALAHECVHIKQFVLKEFSTVCYGQYQRWKATYVDTKKTNYFDLPWEIDAFAQEPVLFDQYYAHLKRKSNYVLKEKKTLAC